MAFFSVVSINRVYVDFGAGIILGFSTGEVFDADPTLPTMVTHLNADPSPIVAFTPGTAFTALPAGVPGGTATLDGGGMIPISQLPTADALDAEVAAEIATHGGITGAHHTPANDPTAAQKAALAGTGTPGGGDLYVSDSDARNTNARTPTSHALAGGEHAASTLAALNTKISDATVVDTGDARFSDARAPTAHASDHTDGTDDIQSATGAQKGLATAAQITKLDAIEALADVTDETNVTAALPVVDGTQLVKGSADASKTMTIEVDGLTTSTNRVLTMADQAVDLTPNTGTFPAAAHAARHTDGSDDIQNATDAQKGLATAAQITKLDGIEASATADQSDAEIKTAYENNADTNEFSDAEQTKLAGIEASATADQTGAEIKAAYEGEANSNEFSDAEQTKLAGIEATADVTDATNVLAAGAPVWQKVTVAETAFTAAATTEDIEVFSLPAAALIHAIRIKHSASFTGGGLSAFTLSVGIGGDLVKYAPAFDVFQAPGSTVSQVSSIVDDEDQSSSTSIRLAAASTDANVADATAGSVDVWLLVSQTA